MFVFEVWFFNYIIELHANYITGNLFEEMFWYQK